ncbi:MAG: hypothetical protein KAI20_06075, partial [Thermoplasmatales archaeon]|nr:hypothetical protein [Thermoplasmatales archaeon]
MSDSTKRLDRLEQRLLPDSLEEEVGRDQWQGGGAAIEPDPSDEKEIFVDPDELFHVNGRWITVRDLRAEFEYRNNIVEFLPVDGTGLVFNKEQLTQINYDRPKFDFYLRKLRYKDRNRGCGTHKLYTRRQHKLVDTHCNQFSCEYCRPRLIRNLKNNIVKYAEKFDLTRFITITFGGKDLRRLVRPDNSFSYVMKRFNNWREYIWRKFGVRVSYINLIRSHKDGYCHLHILIDRFIPKSWLSESTAALGLGSTNVKYVDIHRVSAYLSKYFSEKDHEWFLPEKVHHYTTSRNIHLNDFVPSPDWIYLRMPRPFTKDYDGNVI